MWPCSTPYSIVSARKKYVTINGINSETTDMPYGVAQGSTIGPLLFLLFINDLPNSITSIPRLFAVNTCLICASSIPVILQRDMSWDLLKIHEWCKANKVSLNPSKSNFLVIPPKLSK